MRVGVLFSGGKDSAMALYWAQRRHEPACIITVLSENKDSYMFHTDCVERIPIVAEKIGLPLVFKKTKGQKEKELEDLKTAILEAKNKYRIQGVVSGALASNYQKTRVDKICKELGLRSFAPFWHKDPEQYMQQIIDLGFKIKIVRVASEGLSKDWVGKIIDRKALGELIQLSKKYKFHPGFEGGEAETLVIDGPIFLTR